MRKNIAIVIIIVFISFLALTCYAQLKRGSILKAYKYGRSIGSGEKVSTYSSPFTPLGAKSGITFTKMSDGSYCGSDGNRYSRGWLGGYALKERGANVQFTYLGDGDFAGSDGSRFTHVGHGDYVVSHPKGASIRYTNLGDGSYHGSDGSSYVNLGDGRYVYFPGNKR